MSGIDTHREEFSAPDIVNRGNGESQAAPSGPLSFSSPRNGQGDRYSYESEPFDSATSEWVKSFRRPLNEAINTGA